MADLQTSLQHGGYGEIPGGFIAIVILCLSFGMILQSFAIVYEKFHMDPMKRGLVNQLCTIYMGFAMCFSTAYLVRYSLECLTPQPMPYLVYKLFLWVGWFAWSGCLGCLITMNEVLLFTYWSKMWLKRIPNYNHDFLATWLNAANVVVAFYLGHLQIYNFFEWLKDEENVPLIRSGGIWVIGILFITFIYTVHKLVDYFKTMTTNDVLPIYNVPVQEAPQPPPLAFQMLNTMQYNPDVMNGKAALASVAIIPTLFFCYYIVQLKVAPMFLFGNLILSFYVPLIFYLFNQKLRTFVQNFFRSN